MQPSILIADDDPSMLLLMQAALEEAGFAVTCAADGPSALREFPKAAPNLVLLDVEMPGASGFEVCAALRRDPANALLPIVIVTGLDDTESIDQAFKAGATDFISKPVVWGLIGHRVRYLLRNAQTAKSLERSRSDNQALLDTFPDRIYVLNPDLEVLRTLGQGAGTTRAAAITPAQLRGARLQRWLHETDDEVLLVKQKDDGQILEYRRVERAGAPTLLVERDVTLRERREAQIRQLAFYDSLTGLPNREKFVRDTEKALTAGQSHSILLLCLQRFKRITDTLGHELADDVFVEIAARLRSTVERVDARGLAASATLARLGDDQFAVLASGVVTEGAGFRLGEQLLSTFSYPVTAGGFDLTIGAAVGLAEYPKDGATVVELLKHTETALSSAQVSESQIARYEPELDRANERRLMLEGLVREALQNDGFELYLQPKFDASSEQLSGAEVLLRWRVEDQWVPPPLIVEIAQENGLARSLDDWVINAACGYLARWDALGLSSVPLALNMTATGFSDRALPGRMHTLMSRHGITPGRIELEITESALITVPDVARANVEQLRSAGIHIALDDFGTGYSSLAYLKDFPVQTLKIDRSFVINCDTDPNDRALCGTIISMARSLGMNTVAEGVETEAQLEQLRSLGVETIQGYLWGRPQPVADFEALLGAASIKKGSASS
ncbi:MAG: EAL domain-containing protein [Pseudomonadota bacterium]